MEENTNLACDQEAMFGFYLMLMDIVTNLNTAYEKAISTQASFAKGYMGEAYPEIDLFLQSLPLHIYRLEVFYSKLMEFIYVTADSILKNDIKMKENMEG